MFLVVILAHFNDYKEHRKFKNSFTSFEAVKVTSRTIFIKNFYKNRCEIIVKMFVNQNVLNSGLYTNFQSHPSTSADRQVNQNSVNNNFASTMSSSLYSRLKNNFPYMPNMHNQQSFPNFNFVNGQNLDRFSESFRPQPYMHSQVCRTKSFSVKCYRGRLGYLYSEHKKLPVY